MSILLSSLPAERIDALLSNMNVDQLHLIETACRVGIPDTQIYDYLLQKEVESIVQNDPLHVAMQKGLSWGDIALAAPKPIVEPKVAVPGCGCSPTEWGCDCFWDMPALRLRKDVCAHFPVVVSQIETRNGFERFAVSWHRKNFAAQRDELTNYMDYLDFEEDTYRRLFKALRACHSWTVEAAEGPQDICVLVMNTPVDPEAANSVPKNVAAKSFILPSRVLEDDKTETSSVASAGSAGWEQVGEKIPVLRRLTDIKAHFPVIWNEVQGAKVRTYAVEIFGKQAKERGLDVKKVRTQLLKALQMSSAWKVVPATRPEDRVVAMLVML